MPLKDSTETKRCWRRGKEDVEEEQSRQEEEAVRIRPQEGERGQGEAGQEAASQEIQDEGTNPAAMRPSNFAL